MNSIAKQLAKDAKKKGICDEWLDELKKLKDKREMVAMYVKGIDFCIANNFPTHDYMRENFKGIMELFGVFLNDSICLKNAKTCISNGSTSGILEYSGYGVGEVILKDTSDVVVKAYDNSFIMIDVFDSSSLVVEAYDDAKVCINQYMGLSRISISKSSNAIVKQVKKESTTYVSRS